MKTLKDLIELDDFDCVCGHEIQDHEYEKTQVGKCGQSYGTEGCKCQKWEGAPLPWVQVSDLRQAAIEILKSVKIDKNGEETLVLGNGKILLDVDYESSGVYGATEFIRWFFDIKEEELK